MSLQQTYCTSGVPQSSVLGPILFSIYTSPIAQIAQDYNISLKQYADDTLLYLGLFTSSLRIVSDKIVYGSIFIRLADEEIRTI